jgi:hypothetical protein
LGEVVSATVSTFSPGAAASPGAAVAAAPGAAGAGAAQAAMANTATSKKVSRGHFRVLSGFERSGIGYSFLFFQSVDKWGSV